MCSAAASLLIRRGSEKARCRQAARRGKGERGASSGVCKGAAKDESESGRVEKSGEEERTSAGDCEIACLSLCSHPSLVRTTNATPHLNHSLFPQWSADRAHQSSPNDAFTSCPSYHTYNCRDRRFTHTQCTIALWRSPLLASGH